MPQAIVKKLFDSLSELERSISLAKKTLSAKDPIPLDLLKRVAYYEEVLLKQKTLAKSLCDCIATENWDEVSRHVRLINGLSSLIHDDAKGLVTQLISGALPRVDDVLLS